MPILFLTACPSALLQVTPLLQTSDCLMPKPFKLRELSLQLSKMLEVFSNYGHATKSQLTPLGKAG
jgi:DNA-binding response OmpR family regulator